MALESGRVGVRPDQIDRYGRIIRKNNGGGATELNDLEDVVLSSPSNGQILRYNSTTHKWINSNENSSPTMQEIITAVKQNIYSEIPFLAYKWTKIHYVCDGTHAPVITCDDISGITVVNTSDQKCILLPAGYNIIAYMCGFDTLVKASSLKFNNVGFYLATPTGGAGFYMNAADDAQDITIWFAYEMSTKTYVDNSSQNRDIKNTEVHDEEIIEEKVTKKK